MKLRRDRTLITMVIQDQMMSLGAFRAEPNASGICLDAYQEIVLENLEVVDARPYNLTRLCQLLTEFHQRLNVPHIFNHVVIAVHGAEMYEKLLIMKADSHPADFNSLVWQTVVLPNTTGLTYCFGADRLLLTQYRLLAHMAKLVCMQITSLTRAVMHILPVIIESPNDDLVVWRQTIESKICDQHLPLTIINDEVKNKVDTASLKNVAAHYGLFLLGEADE